MTDCKTAFFLFHDEYTNVHNMMVMSQQYIARRKTLMDKMPNSSIFTFLMQNDSISLPISIFPFGNSTLLLPYRVGRAGCSSSHVKKQ